MKLRLKLLTIGILISARRGVEIHDPTGSGLRVTDVVGFSGQIISSTTSLRSASSIGVLGSTITLHAASGLELRTGLWGGGPSLKSTALEQIIIFGSPRTARLVIPPGAIARDYAVFTGTSPATEPLNASPAILQTATRNLARASSYSNPANGRLWEIYVQDDNGVKQSGALLRSATLTLPFDDADQDGYVDGSAPPVRVKSLSIWWLDEVHSLWVKVPNPTINTSSQTVTALIPHFSVYAVMGAPSFDPSESFAFPVPWRPAGPNAGNAAGQTGTLAGGITFTNLPDACTIRLYTLSGGLIREINHSTGLQETWDGRSADGENVASGTYVWVVSANGSKKTGKLAVIR